MTLFWVMVDNLAAAVAETAQEMARVIQRRLPEYRSFASQEEEHGWRRELRATVDLFVCVTREDRPLSPSEVRHVRTIGETRADQGVPLVEVALNSIRYGMHVVFTTVRRQAEPFSGDPEFGEALDEMSLRMTEFVNAFSTALSRGYMERRAAEGAQAERHRAQFGVDLLSGAYPSYEVARERMEQVGFGLPSTLGVAVLPGTAAALGLLAADTAEELPDALVVPMGVAASPHIALLVPAQDEADWRGARKRLAEVAVRHRTTAVVTEPDEGPEAWHASYVEAATSALLVAEFVSGEALVEARALVPAQFVTAGGATAVAVVEREVLQPLFAHKLGARLLRCLDALMRHDGSPKAAAPAIGLSVRTVSGYRTTIEGVTGRLFGRPTDAMWLSLGWLVLLQKYRHLLD